MSGSVKVGASVRSVGGVRRGSRALRRADGAMLAPEPSVAAVLSAVVSSSCENRPIVMTITPSHIATVAVTSQVPKDLCRVRAA